MSIVGKPERWVSHFLSIHELILGAIERAWERCRTRCTPRTKEDHITRRLVVLIKQDPFVRAAPYCPIISQYELLPKEAEGDVSPKGYIDIAVLFRPDEDELYLAYECKRLNVGGQRRRHSLASEYVRQGMMRFVKAQYAQGLPLGAMLGYVMDGDVSFAASSVKGQIQSRSAELFCGTPLWQDIKVPTAFTTEHHRPSYPIVLRHHLLSVS